MTAPALHPAERFAPAVAGLAFALPVLIAKFPPMSDLPLHEASIGLLRHWGDPRFTPPTLYFINLGHANQLFSLVVLALAYVFPIAWATKLGVAATLIALPLAAAHFADHLDAPRWTALLVAPIGFGWLFFWGLIQNILGIAVLLALLPSIDRFATRPTGRRAAALCGAMLFLHFAHEAMHMVACGALVTSSLGAQQRPKFIALRAVPLAFSAVVAYLANLYAWRFANWAFIQTPRFVYYTFAHKVLSASGVLFGGFEPYVRNLMMLLAALPVLLFAIARIRREAPAGARARPPASSTSRIRGALHEWRFEILAFGLLGIYLVAPANIKTTTLVYHRFLPPAWSILAVSIAARGRNASRLLPQALCAILPVASLLIAWPTFVDSNRVYTDLEVLMQHMEPGSSVVAANYSANQAHRLWNPGVIEGHVIAEHGGRSMFDYTQSPVSILSQRPEKQWVDPVLRLDGHVLDLRPKWDLLRFRYLIFETKSPGIAMAVSMALKDEARLTVAQGDWYLFESTLPLVPIDADDVKLPQPPPPTLRSLVRKAVKELQIAADAEGAEKPQ